MAVIKGRVLVFNECVCLQAYGVVKEAEVHVSVSFYRECSGIFAYQGEFSRYVVMEHLSLFFNQLSSYRNDIFSVFGRNALPGCACNGIGHRKLPELMADESSQPGFCPFIESFTE